MSRPLVVAAVAAELGDVPGRTLGVGPLRAALGMARWIAAERPSSVLLIGSCGVYGDRWPPGTAVVGTRLDLADTGAVMELGYVPLPPEPLDATQERLAADLPRCTVRTLMAITSDTHAAAQHGQAADVEHMETYGAALACAEAEVPFSVVLGVANRVGPSAHAEWLVNREQAEEAARAVARQWLASAGHFLSLDRPTAR